MSSKRITRTVEAVVTDLKIDRDRLVIHAVHQTKDGQVIASFDHNLAFEDMTPKVKGALEAVVEYADAWADEQ